MYDVSANYKYIVQKIVNNETLPIILANVDSLITESDTANTAYQELLNNSYSDQVVKEKFELIKDYVTLQPGSRGEWGSTVKVNGVTSDIQINKVTFTDLYMSALSVGNVPCSIASFECRPYNVVKGDKIEFSISLKDDVIPIGVYYAQDDVSSVESSMTFTAKDYMDTIEQKPYSTSLDYTNGQPLHAVYNELCTICAVQSETVLFNDVVISTAISATTCREALGIIGALIGKNFIINRVGKLEARWFADTDVAYDTSMHFRYDSAKEQSGVNILLCDTGNEAFISGTDGFVLKMTNKHMTQSMLDIARNSVDMTYIGGSIKCIGDPAIDVGDIVYAEDLSGNKKNLPIMSRTFTFNGGCFDEFASYPNTLRTTETTDKKTINQVLKDMLDQIESSKEDLESFTNAVTGSLDDLQSQIDGNITSWFYEVNPTMENEPAVNWQTVDQKIVHLGDLYYNTANETCYRFQITNGEYGWELLSDTDVSKALAAAAKAQDTADSKRRTFVITPFTPYEVGDLWVQGTTGDLMKCVTERLTGNYNSSDWEKAVKYTDDTVANEAKNLATSADRTLAQWCHDNDRTLIDGGKIYCDSLSSINANLGTIIAGILQSENFESNGEELINSDGTINSSYEVLKGILFSLNEMVIKTPQSEWGDNHFYEDGEIRNGTENTTVRKGIRTMSNGNNNGNQGNASFINGTDNIIGKPMECTDVEVLRDLPVGTVSIDDSWNLTARLPKSYKNNLFDAVKVEMWISIGNNEYFGVSLNGFPRTDDKSCETLYSRYSISDDGMQIVFNVEHQDKYWINVITTTDKYRTFQVTKANIDSLLAGNTISIVDSGASTPQTFNAYVTAEVIHFGKNSKASTSNAACNGKGLIVTGNEQTVLGRYNVESDALFVVGNGTSDTNRKNVLEVYADGKYKINSSYEKIWPVYADSNQIADISDTDQRWMTTAIKDGNDIEFNLRAQLTQSNFNSNTRLITTLDKEYCPRVTKVFPVVIGSSIWNASKLGECLIYTTGEVYVTCATGDANCYCVKGDISYKCK